MPSLPSWWEAEAVDLEALTLGAAVDVVLPIVRAESEARIVPAAIAGRVQTRHVSAEHSLSATYCTIAVAFPSGLVLEVACERVALNRSIVQMSDCTATSKHAEERRAGEHASEKA